jgi:hypothetical protein
MRVEQVMDISFSTIQEEDYDLALFSSGYEARCIHIAHNMNPSRASHTAAIGFSDLRNHRQRQSNDEFFQNQWGATPIVSSSGDDTIVYSVLQKLLAPKQRLKILVDYSSMSRLWYAAVLNWARYAAPSREVEIDFAYAEALYELHRTPMVIEDMLSIPGCEGGVIGLRETIAVFGLGFHGLATLCVLERIEADIVYAYLASPASSEDYPELVKDLNRDLLDDAKTQQLLELPLASVETTYRYLGEFIMPHRPESNIILVPMGPKPHVLAAILIAMRFKDVACLRVSAKRTRPEEVSATGPIVATRVLIK